MNLDSHSSSLIHISNLIKRLNKKNSKHALLELAQCVSLETDCQVLRCVLNEISKSYLEAERSGTTGGSGVYSTLLAQPAALLNHPARVTVLCSPFENPSSLLQKAFKPGNKLIGKLSKLYKLSAAQDLALCLVLRYSSNPAIVDAAQQHLKKRFVELVYGYLDSDSNHNLQRSGLQDCIPEVLQSLLIAFSTENFGVAPVTKELFLKRLRREFPREVVPIILAPFLYPESTEIPLLEMNSVEEIGTAIMETSLADLAREMGYGFTASVEECKAAIANFGNRELTAVEAARTIGMMVKYSSGLPDGPPSQTPGSFWLGHGSKKESPGETWNGEVFVQTLEELHANLNWKDVILQLDHPEFAVLDRNGLALLFTILRSGLKNAGYPATFFPVEYICRRWVNSDGQMTLILNILKNPDIFSFADHPFHPVPIDILKTPPEAENKEISTWRCIYLVEALLYLTERGYYSQVQDILMFPMQHCPDILLLALLQLSAPVSIVRQDLITKLVPIFLGNHPNSGIILHHAWHCQNPNVKPIIMHAMADWYLRGECDQSRLTRILDVAQDLKSLTLLLDMQSFPFVIDLACLASRRTYLKLDKWLSDKMRDHGENFVSAMVKFLQRRCPPVIGGKILEEQLPKSAQLPPETIATMLNCLHACLNNVQQELSEAILSVISNCTMVLNKARQPQPITGIIRPHRMLETPFNPSLGGQLFAPPNMESVNSLTPNMANMSLGAPGNAAFAIPGTIGPLMSTSGSPSHMMGAGPNSPFAIMPIPHHANVGNMGALAAARLIPTPLDKPRLPENAFITTEMMPPVSKEIEDDANGYFQRIYNHLHPVLSIEEVLEMLKRFQDSSIKREREVFHCMLRNLFEEYRFFPQYPDKELMITAQLFGGIIEKGLIASYMTLGIALRFVLDALRKPYGSKMYYFGISALDRFKSRLKEYHTYCEHVKAIQHFSEFPPHLIEYVEYGIQSQEPPSKPQGPVLPASLAAILNQTPVTTTHYRSNLMGMPGAITVMSKIPSIVCAGSTGTRFSIANATNIDTLLTATDREDKLNLPPENIQDKTAFIFNNLSQLNLQTKCEELKEIVTEEYYPWLSQYLVMKRASIELNFHALYSLFLDVLRLPDINRMVTKETFRNIKVLLRSDKGIANFSDRSLLKNLGHWLGMLTLGRNRPILQIEIDLKSLILEAYHKGQQELLYVVPFVAKILESSAKSVVFKPPNPWTMAIMNVLAELHQEPELKLNLKFEIEVLCKNLNLDIGDLTPSLYLKDPASIRQIDFQLSQQKQEFAPVQTVTQHHIVPPLPPPPPPPMHLMAMQSNLIPQVEEMQIPSNPLYLVAPEMPMASMMGYILPRYNYIDVDVSASTTFGEHISIDEKLELFNTYPQLKQFVKPAIERSVQEWIHPVVDRAIKYALTTVEQIVRKDFAMEPDENKMITAAHHMMRNLTAGMAMITCREQLLTTINTNLKSAFLPALIPSSPQQKELVDATSRTVAADNMELACVFIQKTAVEKSLPELDKRLMCDFEVRKMARQEGGCHYDPTAFAYLFERMPERLRITAGGVTASQMAAYEEFARNIPGFNPIRDPTAHNMFSIKPFMHDAMPRVAYAPLANPPPMLMLFEELPSMISAAEMFLSNALGVSTLGALVMNMHSLLEHLLHVRRARDLVSIYNLLQKAVEGMLDAYSSLLALTDADAVMRFREIHIRVLAAIAEPKGMGHEWTTNQITRFLLECREELRYNWDAVDCLIRADLINMQAFDVALAQNIDNCSPFAINFARQMYQIYIIEDSKSIHINEIDINCTTSALSRLPSHMRLPPPNDNLNFLTENLRINLDMGINLGPAAHIHSGIMQVRARNYDDPPGLVEKIDLLFREWMGMLYSPADPEVGKHLSVFLHRLSVNGLLKNEDIITRFFRITIQMCIENVYAQLNEEKLNPPAVPSPRSKYYSMPDALVKLVIILIMNSGDSSNPLPKVNLISKVLGIITGYVLQDAEEHGTEFQQLPYHRLLTMLLLDLCEPEPMLESMNYQVLTAFCHTLRIIKPAVVPGFCYAWLELVSHRVFLSRILAVTPQQKGWSMYSTLLVDLLQFMEPFLRNTELEQPVLALYRGALKVMLVLLHDFPEFLCDYHYAFCDEIPPNSIQLRNLILSAFPRSMRLPDPFTPNLKVDLLPEISMPPRAQVNYASVIQSPELKKDLDNYLKLRTPVTFLTELRSTIQISNEPGNRYDTKLINAIVLYVGTQAINSIRSKGQAPSASTIAHSSHMDILQNFAVDLDCEGRYLFINAIANQLRYPNCYTHYFSCALLYLFAEANTKAIQEQITRMLLERLIVNKPHPWGLLVTFIELIKNPVYKFWENDFVHCAPEIQRCLIDTSSLIRRWSQEANRRQTSLNPYSSSSEETVNRT